MRLPFRYFLGINSFKNFIIDDIANYYEVSSITREIITFQNYRDHPIELFYIFCFSTFMILYIFKNNKKELKIMSLVDKNLLKCIRVFIIIFTMIFTKDIENAI